MQGQAFIFPVGRSQGLQLYLLLLHLFACCAVWLTPLGWLWQLGATLLLTGSLLIYGHRYLGWLQGNRLVAIEHNEKGLWRLHFMEHKTDWMHINAAYIAFFGVALQFKRHHFPNHAILIATDAIDAQQFRKLRVCLRDARTYRQE